MTGILRWLPLVLLAACASIPNVAPERIAALKQADDEDALKGCKPLGRFVGYSAQSGEAGFAQARQEARAKCAEAGATDYAFVNESDTTNAIMVAAKAYDCTVRK
jgi:hypothetical protein